MNFLLFLLLIGGIILGGAIVYLILRPSLKHIIQQNDVVAKENQELEKVNEDLKIQQQGLKEKTEELKQQALNVKWEYNELRIRRDEVKNSLNDLEKQSTDAAQKFYTSALEVAQNSFDKEIDNINKELDNEREQAKEVYLSTLQECVNDFLQEIDKKSQELSALNIKIKNEQENVDAAVAAAKRRQLMENQKDFYRLNLTEEDITEIKRLREVLPYLRDKTPLNKVIYKIYYEKPLTDMIGRVVGTGTHTGIYKITHINSEKCYVGQAVNIGR